MRRVIITILSYIQILTICVLSFYIGQTSLKNSDAVLYIAVILLAVAAILSIIICCCKYDKEDTLSAKSINDIIKEAIAKEIKVIQKIDKPVCDELVDTKNNIPMRQWLRNAKEYPITPLGVLSLMVVLVIACLFFVTVFGKALSEFNQIVLILFSAIFPFVLLVVLIWMISKHPDQTK